MLTDRLGEHCAKRLLNTVLRERFFNTVLRDRLGEHCAEGDIWKHCTERVIGGPLC